MDSVNLIKGYGKVTNLEDQSPIPTNPPTTRKPLKITLAISSIIILSILIALTIITTSHPKHSERESPSKISSLSAIKAICNTTLYPTTCLSTLSPITKPDPENILKQSLQLTIQELSKLITTISNESQDDASLKDCKDQFEDALSRIKDSVARMEVIKPGEQVLDEMKISDIQTWVSAALTDEQTCLDGLEEVGSKLLEQVKASMQKSKELTSNSLAIVAHIHTLLAIFGMKLH